MLTGTCATVHVRRLTATSSPSGKEEEGWFPAIIIPYAWAEPM